MRAIVDYGNDEAVFVAVNPDKCVPLETTATGHQVIPLARDFMREGYQLKAPVRRIGAPE